MNQKANTPDDAQCRRCGYLLRGLDDPVCPECGTGFDRADAATFVTSQTLVGDRHLKFALAGAVVTFVSQCFASIGHIPGEFTPGMIVQFCLLGLGYLTELVVAIWCVCSLISLRGNPIKKGRLIQALVVAMVILVGCLVAPAALMYMVRGF